MGFRRTATASGLLAILLLSVGCQSNRWAGTWQKDDDPNYGGDLHCTVKQVDDQNWQARFTGYCGRQFAYEITMEGRGEGDTVLFKGEADLGEQDGGLYQWTGRIERDAFAGQYVSSTGKKGSFAMSRK